MGAPTWSTAGSVGQTYAPDPWDSLTLSASGSSWVLPGIVEITTLRSTDVDVRKPQGQHGGTLTFKGTPPADVEIDVRVWTKTQWDALQKILAEISPKPRGAMTAAELKKIKEGRAFAAAHPALAVLGIRSIAIVSVGSPRAGTAVGEKLIPIKAKEYFAPGKTSKTAIKKVVAPVALVKALQDKDPASRPANAPKASPSQDKTFCGPNG